jgi:ferric-dicitrate binding protein FerR (iron transport regulator)
MREAQEARNGAAVREGDRIATGAGSSAIIEYYNGGGKLQLDADSAARFRKERTAPGVCSLVDLSLGRAWVRADEGCGVELRALDYVVRINGRANVVLNDERFEVTVTGGSAVLLQPRNAQLSAGQSYTDNEAQVRSLDKAQSKARLAWVEPYAFQGWCCYGRTVMPAARGQCSAPNFSFDESTLTMQCKHKDNPFSFLGRLRGRN